MKTATDWFLSWYVKDENVIASVFFFVTLIFHLYCCFLQMFKRGAHGSFRSYLERLVEADVGNTNHHNLWGSQYPGLSVSSILQQGVCEPRPLPRTSYQRCRQGETHTMSQLSSCCVCHCGGEGSRVVRTLVRCTKSANVSRNGSPSHRIHAARVVKTI
jgi:hypothetical protein